MCCFNMQLWLVKTLPQIPHTNSRFSFGFDTLPIPKEEKEEEEEKKKKEEEVKEGGGEGGGNRGNEC